MKALRNVVFPLLRILIWAVIAAALVKLAFFAGPADTTATGDDPTPGSDFTASAYQVGRADVISVVKVTASVVADPAVEAKSPADGYVGYWAVAEGATVYKGDPIAEVRQSTEDGAFNRYTVLAPADGIIHLSVKLNAELTRDTVIFTVAPSRLVIQGELTPADRYRLTSDPTTAEVTLTDGPPAFTCQEVTVGATSTTPASGSDSDSGEASPSPSTTTLLRCPAPEGVRLVPGLTGTMSVPAGEARDVIAVPVTAVQGLYESGKVWVLDAATGEATERDVTLGLNDGTMVEITGGLDEGEEIQEFAPGNMEPIEDATVYGIEG